MKTYSEEFKTAIIKKMLPPHNVSVPHLAQETGIPRDTLYTWRSQMRRAPGLATPTDSQTHEQWSSEAKFAIVVETAALTEAELSAYCRQKGLYPEQLATWRRACQQANPPGAKPSATHRLRSQHQAKRIKQLEAERRRKEKALAEAAALLVLQKNNLAAGLLPVGRETSYTTLELEGSGRWLFGGATPRKNMVQGLLRT